MNATEFYKLFEEPLRPRLIDLGFSRVKGKASRWTILTEHGRFSVFFRTSGKYPWEIYCGGRFSFDAFLNDNIDESPQEAEANIETVVDCLSYLDDSTFGRLSQINAAVCSKVELLDRSTLMTSMGAIGASESDVELLHSSSVTSLKWASDVQRSEVNPSLLYYDAADVALWASFFADNVGPMFEGVRSEPARPFRKAVP